MHVDQWNKIIHETTSLSALEEIRVQLLGKNGEITTQLKTLGNLSPEERKEKGAEINALKERVTQVIEEKKNTFAKAILDERLATETVDVTLSSRPESMGKIHPISKVMIDIAAYFNNLGFQVFDGPHIENAEHNFDALNIPAHHPARQSHDTFYLKNLDLLLRTHTSPVQVRTLRQSKPPIRFLAMGRVFRSDYDATHSPMFHQLELVVIEEDIHFGHLKGLLIDFLRWFFADPNIDIRLRPSFFPFTEPSAEVDMTWKDGWLEILGCGMIHPNVLKACEIDQNQQGFAVGMGIERLAMLKYGLTDLRAFYEGDMRFLQAYGFGLRDL